MAVIPFYGAQDRELFGIERSSMDRPGHVLARLAELLPAGPVLDVGAGDGFTASGLTTSARTVVPLEPAQGMVDLGRVMPWVLGDAEHLPFRDGSFSAAYSTWAYFFPRYFDVTAGLAELERVVHRGGPMVIVDNAGDDEFCAMADRPIHADLDFWRTAGFEIEVIETAFVFESMADAARLLVMFFGDGATPALEVGFNVAVMVKPAG